MENKQKITIEIEEGSSSFSLDEWIGVKDYIECWYGSLLKCSIIKVKVKEGGREEMRVIRVEDCWGCPNHCWREDLEKHVCTKSNLKEVNLHDKIPSWCPLEIIKIPITVTIE